MLTHAPCQTRLMPDRPSGTLPGPSERRGPASARHSVGLALPDAFSQAVVPDGRGRPHRPHLGRGHAGRWRTADTPGEALAVPRPRDVHTAAVLREPGTAHDAAARGVRRAADPEDRHTD